jgi:hypothetical protein
VLIIPAPSPPARVRFTHPLPVEDNIIIGRPAQYVRALFATIGQRARARARKSKREKNEVGKNHEGEIDSRLKAKEDGDQKPWIMT